MPVTGNDMEFLCGAIHPQTDRRYVFAGRATPTVSHLVYLADAVQPELCDWGETAHPEALTLLAGLVCLHMGWRDAVIQQRLCQAFGLRFATGKMWLIQKHELESWAAGETVN